MLEQLQKDWKAAITSNERKLLKQDFCEGADGQQVVKHQKVLFKFRNTEAIMELELFRGDEMLEDPKKRRYRNTVQVPSTNKQVVIFPREWKSPVEKMMTILIAFTKGRDHEDRVAIRRQLAVMRENDKVIDEFKARLNKTSFDNDEKNFIVQWLDNNSNSRKMLWNRVLLEILVKYHNYITGRGLIELGINLGPEANRHVRRCYDTAAKIISASTHDNGKRYLPREVANPLFLGIKDVPMAIYVVRSMFAKIWDRCFEEGNNDNSMLFAWVCDFLGAYYAKITGVPLENHCTELQQRYVEAKNRRTARKIEGRNNQQRRFREAPQGPIVTIEDAYGDVLDQAAEQVRKRFDKKERVNPKDRRYEEDGEAEATLEQPQKPQLKRKLRPVVVTAETAESNEQSNFEEQDTKDLGSIGDAFDKADLL